MENELITDETAEQYIWEDAFFTSELWMRLTDHDIQRFFDEIASGICN